MAVAYTKKSLLAAFRLQLEMEQRAALLARYDNQPVLWTEERTNGFVWSIPRKIMNSVVENRRTAVQAHHALGKSWICGRLATWWIDSHPPGTAFVVTTAPSAKQVKAVLWKEIRRAWVAAGLGGRLNQDAWWINNELIAMGRKPNDYDPTAFQGIHAKYVLVILDEACGIPEQIYIAANSLAANEFSRIVAIGNPDDPDSHFAKVCSVDSGWNVIAVSAFDTPNFTGEEVPQEVKDVLVSHIFVEEMKKDVGEDSPVYISKVLGRFPENKADGVIPLSWIRQCQDEDERDSADGSEFYPIEAGIDVGAGGDETCCRIRFGRFVGPMVEQKTPRAEDAFALLVPFLMEHKPTRIKIDNIGVGWGLISLLSMARLRSISSGGYEDESTGIYVDLSFLDADGIVPVNVGMRATDPEKFPRLRDQMWWEVGRLLSQDKGWNLTGLDEKTVEELTRPVWERDISNRHRIETKQEMMKRTGRPSPNRADALLMAYTNPPTEDIEELMVVHEPVVIGPDI